MPRTRRSKKYKRKTVKRKGGNPFLRTAVKYGQKFDPLSRRFATDLAGQVSERILDKLNTPKSQSPSTSTVYNGPAHSLYQAALPATITKTTNTNNKTMVNPSYVKANALLRGLTTFSYPSLPRILTTNMTAKTSAAYVTTEYVRDIISLFEPVVQAALDDIIMADVSVSEKVVKSIITDDMLSPGDIKTTLVNVLAKHLQIIAPKLKEELGKTKFVDVSPAFMKIIQPYLDNLFNDLKEELSATIIRKITNAVDKLKVDNISAEWRTKKENLQKKFEEKFRPAFDEFVKSSYSDKIKMMYSYSMLSYNNTMVPIREQKQSSSKPKIKITDFAKDWYSSTKELLGRWSEAIDENPDVLTINVLISAIDLSIPTLIDEYCNYWNPDAACNKQRIQSNFDNILQKFLEFGANYEKTNWDEFSNL